jgi:DNA-binding NtrC family response regulator
LTNTTEGVFDMRRHDYQHGAPDNLFMSDEINSDSNTSLATHPLNVIVAEKYPIARAALAALLTYDGFQAFQAENLKSAISYINEIENVAVVLADLEMLGWRSIVRHAATTTSALVIGMEGNQPISEMYNLTQRGIRLCFQKPIDYATILAAIRKNIAA